MSTGRPALRSRWIASSKASCEANSQPGATNASRSPCWTQNRKGRSSSRNSATSALADGASMTPRTRAAKSRHRARSRVSTTTYPSELTAIGVRPPSGPARCGARATAVSKFDIAPTHLHAFQHPPDALSRRVRGRFFTLDRTGIILHALDDLRNEKYRSLRISMFNVMPSAEDGCKSYDRSH